MADSIITTRQDLADLIGGALGSATEVKAVPYPPKPLSGPCVYVESPSGPEGATFSGPVLRYSVIVLAAGDDVTGRQRLDRYTELVWDVLADETQTRFTVLGFEPTTADDTPVFPAYRFTVTAPL